MKNATQSVDISLFRNFLGNKYEIYKGEKQNDSQEFCRNLLENMSSELNEIKNKSPYLELSNTFSKSKKARYEIFYDDARKKEKSIITDLFYSILGKTLKCECNKEFYVFQELLDIPLLIPENTENIDIINLLQNYFKNDSIEKFCDQCKEQKKCSQNDKMARPPEILILSIQRFKDNNSKNECNVKFNEILDINEFIDRDCGYNEESLYSLFGVINHFGIVNFGHYYSYIKVNNKDWYEFNDDSVKEIDCNFDTSKAYILFYIRIH
jgi:ubiquitin C-terminal hydrolase